MSRAQPLYCQTGRQAGKCGNVRGGQPCVFSSAFYACVRAKECSPACRAAPIVTLVFASDRLQAQKNNPLIRSSAGSPSRSQPRRKSRDLYQMCVDKSSKEVRGVAGRGRVGVGVVVVVVGCRGGEVQLKGPAPRTLPSRRSLGKWEAMKGGEAPSAVIRKHCQVNAAPQSGCYLSRMKRHSG